MESGCGEIVTSSANAIQQVAQQKLGAYRSLSLKGLQDLWASEDSEVRKRGSQCLYYHSDSAARDRWEIQFEFNPRRKRMDYVIF